MTIQSPQSECDEAAVGDKQHASTSARELRVSAVLVSFNTRELTRRCVGMLWDQLDPVRDEVIVVDNASTDGTVAQLQRDWPTACDQRDFEASHRVVRIIENPINAGFGAANNLGMAEARGDYFLLINTDAFVEAGAIRAMLDKLEAEPKWGVVGPKLLNRDGSLQRSCFRFPKPSQAWREAFALHYVFSDLERWTYNEDREVPFVSGACFMMRRSVYETVGGFDERYFMYCEESDWQRRMADSGWRIGFTPDAQVVHYGGASNTSGKIHPHFFLSLDKYLLKHHGWLGLVLFRLGMMTGIVLRLPYRLARLVAGDREGLLRSLRLLRRQALSWPVRKAQGLS
jgi:hypothetical protein